MGVNSREQAAALAFRGRKICLVTTRSGKGLIIPKGHVPDGTSAARLAAREAWEEAGLNGRIARRPFGEYTFLKADREQTVQIFLLAVTKLVREWPERPFRRRLWFPLEAAIPAVTHTALRSLLEEFAESEAHAGSSGARRRRKCA